MLLILEIAHDQPISFELIKKFNGTKLEKITNIATMFAQCLHIFKLFI